MNKAQERTCMKTACTSRIDFFKQRALVCFALYATGLDLAFGPLSSAMAGDNTATELNALVPAQTTGGMWTATGDLGTPRDKHTATLLPCGEVLLTGGE